MPSTRAARPATMMYARSGSALLAAATLAVLAAAAPACGDDAADDGTASSSGGAGTPGPSGAGTEATTQASSSVGMNASGRPDFESIGGAVVMEDVPPTIDGLAAVRDVYVNTAEYLAWTERDSAVVTYAAGETRIPWGSQLDGLRAFGLAATEYHFWWMTSDPADPGGNSTVWSLTAQTPDEEPYDFFTDVDGLSLAAGVSQVFARRGDGLALVVAFGLDESYDGVEVPPFVAGGSDHVYTRCGERVDARTGAVQTLTLEAETLAMFADQYGATCLVRKDSTPDEVNAVQWETGGTTVRGVGEIAVDGLERAEIASTGLHLVAALHEASGDRLVAFPYEVTAPVWEVKGGDDFTVLAITHSTTSAGFLAALGYTRIEDDGSTRPAASIVKFTP